MAKGALAVALGFVCALATLFWLTRPSERVLMRWTGPGGEEVLLYEGERDYGGFPFERAWHHYVFIGHDPAPSGYGHRVSFDLHPELAEPPLTLEDYAKRVRATFSDAGLELAEPSGHRLFIPKRAYTGGR